MANKRARRGAGRNKRGLNVEFDGALVDESGGEGAEKLGDPESVPHADRSEQAAENRTLKTGPYKITKITPPRETSVPTAGWLCII